MNRFIPSFRSHLNTIIISYNYYVTNVNIFAELLIVKDNNKNISFSTVSTPVALQLCAVNYAAQSRVSSKAQDTLKSL